MHLETETRAKDYLFISDFDQTLSFHDSGIVLSDLIGAPDFAEKIAGLIRINPQSNHFRSNWRTVLQREGFRFSSVLFGA